MRKPLDGYRILEIGNHESSAFSALMLCEYGAQVTQLLSPSCSAADPAEQAPLNRGKERICLDYASDGASDELQQHFALCDAVITADISFASHRNFGYQAVRRSFSSVVYTLISAFGATGPFREHSFCDAVIQAESGVMSITGESGKEPVLTGSRIATYLAGCMGCIGTLMALLDTRRTGRGRFVDVSAMDTILFGLENQFSVSLKAGNIPGPLGNSYSLSAPVGVFPCLDGSVIISVATDAQWKAFAQVFGREDWLQDPRFATIQDRLLNRREINAETAAEFKKYSYEELTAMLQSRSCVYGRVNDFSDVAVHPQVAYRHTFIDITCPDGSICPAVAVPFLMNGIPRENRSISDVTAGFAKDII